MAALLYLKEDCFVEATSRTVDVSGSLQGWVLKQQNQRNVKIPFNFYIIRVIWCTLFTSDKMTSSLVLGDRYENTKEMRNGKINR